MADDDTEKLPKDRPRGVLGRIVSGALSYGVVALIIWFLIQQLTTKLGLNLAGIGSFHLGNSSFEP